MPSFKKSLIVEQFQGNYLKVVKQVEVFSFCTYPPPVETSAGSLTNLKMSGVRKYQHKHKYRKSEKFVWPGCCARGENVQLCPLWDTL